MKKQQKNELSMTQSIERLVRSLTIKYILIPHHLLSSILNEVGLASTPPITRETVRRALLMKFNRRLE